MTGLNQRQGQQRVFVSAALSALLKAARGWIGLATPTMETVSRSGGRVLGASGGPFGPPPILSLIKYFGSVKERAAPPKSKGSRLVGPAALLALWKASGASGMGEQRDQVAPRRITFCRIHVAARMEGKRLGARGVRPRPAWARTPFEWNNAAAMASAVVVFRLAAILRTLKPGSSSFSTARRGVCRTGAWPPRSRSA